jgi:hypothetical protein
MGTSFCRFIGFASAILVTGSGPTIAQETAPLKIGMLPRIGCAGHAPNLETVRAALFPTHPRKDLISAPTEAHVFSALIREQGVKERIILVVSRW